MGEASVPGKEFILALLPFPQDESVTKILDGVRSKHPNAEFEYQFIPFVPGAMADTSNIPEGRFSHILHLLMNFIDN